MSENERPSIDELYALMRSQQDRIDELERTMSKPGGADDPAAEATVPAVAADREPPSGGMSRAGLLRRAAVGAAGVAGATLLVDPSVASAATGAFTSSSSTPAVSATSTGTGQAVNAVANTAAAAIVATNKGTGPALNAGTASTAIAASAIKGSLTATSAGAGAAGVRGVAAGTKPTSAGVIGTHSGSGIGVTGTSSTGVGVEGDSASTAGYAMAVHGLISSSSPGGFSAGVRGENAGTGGNGIGVYGSHLGSGWGVYGTSPDGYGVLGDSDSNAGVYGTSGSGAGVYGSSVSGAGVYGFSDGGAGISAVSSSTADDANALYAYLDSSSPGATTAAVYASNVDTSTSGSGVFGTQAGDGYGVWGEADGGDGYGVYGVSANGYGVVGSGAVYALYGDGNFAVSGTKAAVVPLSGETRTFYCVESPECWFEDFGSAALKSGSVSVSLDELFAEAVETGSYYVFLSPEGNCKGLFVTNKTATGFAVQELEGGSSSVAFSYRIVARRANVDAPRLAIAPTVPSQKSAAPHVAAPKRSSVTVTQ